MENQNPLISVIMPVLNVERYVHLAARSILEQTLGDLELLILDDGSVDRTLDICYGIAAKDSRVRVIEQPNSRISRLLNRGVKEARGKFLARMDGDDISLPHRFERQYHYLQNEGVDCIGTFARLIDPNGLHLTRVTTPVYHDDIFSRLLLGDGSSLIHASMFCRTHVISDVGMYDPSFDFVEDLELLLRIGQRYRLGNQPELLYYYRQHPRSVNHNFAFQQNHLRRKLLKQFRNRIGLLDVPEEYLQAEGPSDVKWPDRYRRWAWRLLLEEGNRGQAIRLMLEVLRTDPCNYSNLALLKSILKSTIFPREYW